MPLLSINDLFASRGAAAVAWTLFHSLWQGLIVALLAALILIWTKRSRPTIRYNGLSILFFALTALFFLTFFYELQDTGTATPVFSTHPAIGMSGEQINYPAVIRSGQEGSVMSVIGQFLSRNCSLIVSVWLIVLGVKMARMLFLLGYTRYIIRYKTRIPAPYWKNRMTRLCRHLHITRPITLLESKIVRLPVVFGQLKPVILMPLGLLAQLPPGQVEAILLHELAHIRRNDYLVNLLQNVVETLFFFNPALLWLSRLIRDERENCCDDLAIGQIKDKKQYVESLISFTERSLVPRPLSAVGFAGRKNSFFNRISRIVENKNYTLSPFEKGSLTCSSIVAAALAFVIMSPGKEISRDRSGIITAGNAEVIRISRPAAISPPTDASRNPGKKKPRMHAVATKTDTLPVAHDTLPPTRAVILERMHQVIGDLVKDKIAPDSAGVESFALDVDVLMVNDQQQPEPLHEKFKTKYNIQKGAGLYYGPERTPGKGFFITEDPWQGPLRQEMMKLRQDIVQQRKEMVQARQEMARAKGARPERLFRAWQLDTTISEIVDDLVAAGIVRRNADPLSFKLTNRELVVNDFLQPEALHQTLRHKYILLAAYSAAFPDIAEDPDFGLHYYSKTNRMGLGIHHWRNASN